MIKIGIRPEYGEGIRGIVAFWIQMYFYCRQKFFPSKEMKVQKALGTLLCPGTQTVKVIQKLDKLYKHKNTASSSSG